MLSGNELRIDQAVYLDTPVLSAVRQIIPFYRSGIFSFAKTPVLLRLNKMTRLQLLGTTLPQELWFERVEARRNASEWVQKGGVVFYPFNAASNVFTITNRQVKHVLTLHGESNKAASNRYAARLYDYVSVAGPLARDRYLESGIFTDEDADNGRLVMMGDSFVQSISWLAPVEIGSPDASILYAPTWEGHSKGMEDYSSVRGGRGFQYAIDAARAVGSQSVIVKPHPYLGLLRRSLFAEFVKGVRQVQAAGLQVKLALEEANLPLRMTCRVLLRDVETIDETKGSDYAVSFGLCDVSGIEAIFLKQRLPHVVIAKDQVVPTRLLPFYYKKCLLPDSNAAGLLRRYLDSHQDLDARHRSHVFGWQEPEMEQMSAQQRRDWLMDYVRTDPFWTRSQYASPLDERTAVRD